MVEQQTIPRISGLPLLGNLLELQRDRLSMLKRLVYECGEIGSFRIGRRAIVVSNKPEHAQIVLVDRADDFEKTPFLDLMRPLLGNGLLTSRNEFHRRQRKLVAPAFQYRRIAEYAAVMAEYAERSQARWVDGATIDVAEEMMRLTLWIIGKTLFDADVAAEARELGRSLTLLLKFVIAQIGAVIPIPQHWPTPRNRRVQQAIDRLDATVYRMIAERRASGGDCGDLLSMLLQARDEDDGGFMTDQQVRDEAMTLFLAGHETTAVALVWSWYLLTQHPQNYARMQAEIDHVLAGRAPALADLPNLPYTLQVLKEAMRMYPPAYILGRVAIRPVDLGDYQLAAGTIIDFSPYIMHRRPDIYPEPERFVPERWTPEFERSLPRHAYMPFGAGPRICIGNHFAMMEGHFLLAALAQRITFELAPGQRIAPEPMITLRPKDGIKMIVRRRYHLSRSTDANIDPSIVVDRLCV